ncbi:MAG: NADPH-dependent 7-cyano-7-deazaguanine reductase QueF [Candidatus Kinetoplastibacterium crithidii]|nr:NADPH-dependent 7-cyano-7-deazaguanine reductase QueF [Candidatus Kinetoplastibacterium crithidii]
MKKIENPLGKQTNYPLEYNPNLLFPLERKYFKNNKIFKGFDIWNAYEISWLNKNGKPEIAIGRFQIPANSKYIIESKSLKIYLNSLNQKKFDNYSDLTHLICNDLSSTTNSDVLVNIIMPQDFKKIYIQELDGLCIDHLQIKTDIYNPDPNLLENEKTNKIKITETLMSRLLKSNCPITMQPDWASIQIRYRGFKINHESILKYIISYRNHSGYHENCIEKIFLDIYQKCKPEYLSVYGKYTRRGGIDINPWRSTDLEEYNPVQNLFRSTRQ